MMRETREAAFRHEVMFYEDEDQFLETAVPFLCHGLEAGEPMLVAVGRRKVELLEGELGEDSAGVRFTDMVELGRNPARIIPAWREFLELNLQPGKGARGIGEPIWPERSDSELDECQRHESLLNVAFGSGPGWSLLCPYDSRRLDDGVLETARANHPYLRCDGSNGPCAGWDDLDGFSPFAGSLPAPPSRSRTLAFDCGQLREVRALVGAEASAAGMGEGRAADLTIAVGELAANSVRHGGGRGTLRAWRQGGSLLAEVEDDGRIAEPLAGRMRPTGAQADGRGLWMANQLCDLVQIRSGETGTAVRLWMSLD
jgi:anti-sigma regulatory factor (Ser/Thr protein kinase)